MIKNFNLVQKGEFLENELEISVMQGESINLTFKALEFEPLKANVKINDKFIGTTINSQIGVHSSKLRKGYNQLLVDFLDKDNRIIKSFEYRFVVVPPTTEKSISDTYKMIYTELELLKEEIYRLKNWKQEIDNERSGF